LRSRTAVHHLSTSTLDGDWTWPSVSPGAGADEGYAYDDYRLNPDPPHQPMYLELVLRWLRSDRAINTVLDAGGLLIVTTPYWGYLKNVALALTNRMDASLTALWDGGHIKHWSRKTLSTLLTEQSFEVIGFSGAGRRVPYLWNSMVMVARKPAVPDVPPGTGDGP